MKYEELKAKVRAGEVTEIQTKIRETVHQIRWQNRRLETLSPLPGSVWQAATRDSLICDFGIGASPIKPVPNILDLLDYGE